MHERAFWIGRVLALASATFLLAVAVALELGREAGGARALPAALVVAACALAVAGWRYGHHRVWLRISLVITSSALVLTVGEMVCRAIGFDFERIREFSPEVPIYYRPPTLHAGEGVFRRPGPATWSGKVLTAYMHLHGASAGPYADERAVTASYDADGFRNPQTLTDWEMVVAGDSFVELGYLDDGDLFTTRAARTLGVRVKNLGVSCTGPVSQTFYVKRFGKAASTRDAVLCFYEGNDLNDLERENRNAEAFRQTGHPFEHAKQTSLFRAACRAVTKRRTRGQQLPGITPNATLLSHGQQLRTTVYSSPPVWERMSARRRTALTNAIHDWATTVRALGMRPAVMYIPDSHRVYHGMLRYDETNSAVAQWNAGDFAGPFGTLCSNLNVRFINTFPALRKAAENGGVPFNLIGDTHLSAEGSHVVAEVLAQAFQSRNAAAAGTPP